MAAIYLVRDRDKEKDLWLIVGEKQWSEKKMASMAGMECTVHLYACYEVRYSKPITILTLLGVN